MTPAADTQHLAAFPRLSRSAGLVLAAGMLLLLVGVSAAVGARSIPLAEVLDHLRSDDGSQDAAIVRELRIPRTLVGIAVGAALGLSGALMQAITRNPLADPGLLGVQAGASAAIVVAIGLLGVTDPAGYVWFAFVGAALASIAVYALGSAGRGGATPVRLALAGTAMYAALSAFIEGVTLLDPVAFDDFRFWRVGSLAGRDLEVLAQVGPFLLGGALLALALARSLNAIALGDETGRALSSSP